MGKLHHFKGYIGILSMLLAVMIMLTACYDDDSKPLNTGSRYFDLEKIANTVQINLKRSGKSFTKNAILNEVSYSDTINGDEVGSELELLKDFDISKKAWDGLFEENRRDSGEYSFIVYTALSPKPHVRLLTVAENTLSGRMNIEGIIRKNNRIYSMEKQITTQLKKGKFGYELLHARLQGYQKIILVDSLRFDVLYNLISGS